MPNKTGDDNTYQTSPQNQTTQTSINQQERDLVELAKRFFAAGGLLAYSGRRPDPVDVATSLQAKPRVTVAFPPCANELLGLVRSDEKTTGGRPSEFATFFNDYFKFSRHRTFGQDKDGSELDQKLGNELDPSLVSCLSRNHTGSPVPLASGAATVWPSDCCICSPCLTLDGSRTFPPHPAAPPTQGLRRLFVGDVIWLFYFERMGLNQMLGAILDAFASNGRLPISNGSIASGIRDDLVALVLEIMVRQTKMGLSSSVRDRASLYRRALGWVSEAGRKLNIDSEVNTAFNTLFHKFIYHALEYYRDKRLAIAIQGAATGGVARPSVATLVTVSETLEVLKTSFEPFDYGRNYYNTLSGIIWTIAALHVVRALTDTLGIPGAFGDPHEFIPAAYDLLVLKRPVTTSTTNRYIVHRECARHGRDIVLGMEVINHLDTGSAGELDRWLTQIEPNVEAYRTSYRSMTGVDLGTSPTPTIEQQA